MYVFMNGDTPIKEFDLLNQREATNGMTTWLSNRQSNRERAGMEAIFSEYNLNNFDSFIKITHCLGLNDCYWVKDLNDSVEFSKINLYDNEFDEIISRVAFTGEGKFKPSISPEYTTHGSLAKRWIRAEGNIYLAKGGDFEPYAEYIASKLAEFIGIKSYVKYTLSTIGGSVVSLCKLFTSKQFGFRPSSNYLHNYLYSDVVELFGDYKEFWDMMLFDYLIVNTDRHFNNFGFIVDNKTEKVIGMAPIFDNGNGCLSQWNEKGDMEKYVESRVPVFGGSFYNNMKFDYDKLLRAADFRCDFNQFADRASCVIRSQARKALDMGNTQEFK